MLRAVQNTNRITRCSSSFEHRSVSSSDPNCLRLRQQPTATRPWPGVDQEPAPSRLPRGSAPEATPTPLPATRASPDRVRRRDRLAAAPWTSLHGRRSRRPYRRQHGCTRHAGTSGTASGRGPHGVPLNVSSGRASSSGSRPRTTSGAGRRSVGQGSGRAGPTNSCGHLADRPTPVDTGSNRLRRATRYRIAAAPPRRPGGGRPAARADRLLRAPGCPHGARDARRPHRSGLVPYSWAITDADGTGREGGPGPSRTRAISTTWSAGQ